MKAPDIQYKETTTYGLLEWHCGKYSGHVYTAPYWSDNESWLAFDDEGERQRIEQRVIQQARDIHAVGSLQSKDY